MGLTDTIRNLPTGENRIAALLLGALLLAGCGNQGDEQLRPTSQLLTMQLTSPVAVVNGVIIIGGTAAKFSDASSTNGAVRAFSARTGEHLWTFDTLIREPAADPESSAWHVGGANAWTTFSWESENDLVFIPTASPSPDFYGGKRPGNNLYGNSLVVLRASTGERVWHYQIVHHDVWDWDLPANPILAEITRDGEKVPVVMQLAKQGMVFTFHRYTGEPFFEIEERPVPTDGLPDDALSPTQPFPVSETPSWVRLIPNEDLDTEVAGAPGSGLPMGPPGFIDGTDYGLQQGVLFSPFMTPCTEPPWGKLVAVDMAAGEILWEEPLGLIDKLSPVPIPLRWGTPFAGGPIATGGGVVFIGATADERFRAYDTLTGELLWEFDGPTSANATPMTYMAGGKQFVVVATGGHSWVYPFKKGDTVVAYSLPD